MSIDPNEIDLLVDGELPDDRRKRLLLTFEQAPEGWRACALAFLEAQCWREQMRGLAGEVQQSRGPSPEAPASGEAASVRPPVAAATPPTRHRSPARSALRTVAAMAASFLLTMVGVGLLRMHWGGGNMPSGFDVAQAPSPDESPRARALDDFRPRYAPQDQPAPRPEAGGMSLVSVPLPGGEQGGREVLLPVVEAEHFNDGLLAPPAPPVIDPRLEALARQHGMELLRHRQMMPLHTREGHDIVVPVNSYHFRRRDAADIQ